MIAMHSTFFRLVTCVLVTSLLGSPLSAVGFAQGTAVSSGTASALPQSKKVTKTDLDTVVLSGATIFNIRKTDDTSAYANIIALGAIVKDNPKLSPMQVAEVQSMLDAGVRDTTVADAAHVALAVGGAVKTLEGAGIVVTGALKTLSTISSTVGSLQQTANSILAAQDSTNNADAMARQAQQSLTQLIAAAKRPGADPIVGSVVDLIIGKYNGSGTYKDDIAQTSLNNLDYAPIASALLNVLNQHDNNGDVTLNPQVMAALTSQFKDRFDETRNLLAGTLNGILADNNNLQNVSAFIQGQKDAAARAQKAKDDQTRLDAERTGVYLLSTVIAFGDPKLGHDLATVGNAAITIADSASKIHDIGTLLDTGAFVATGNIVAAAMSVFSLFGPSSSPDQAVLDAIQGLKQDLVNLTNLVQARFDRIDSKLSDLMSTVSDGFDRVNFQLGQLQDSVSNIEGALLDAQTATAHLETDLKGLLNTGFGQPLIQTINATVGYQVRTNTRMPYRDFVNAESTLTTWDQFASDDIRAGSCTPGLTDDDVLSTFTTPASWSSVNFLVHFPTKFGLPPLVPGCAANPRVWALIATAYETMLAENPASAARISPSGFQTIYDTGLHLRNVVHNITMHGDKANTALFSALKAYYLEGVPAVAQELQRLETSHTQNPANGIQKIDIWGPPQQVPDAPLSQSTADGYGIANGPEANGPAALAYPITDKLKNLFIIPNEFRTAHYLKLGNLKFFVDNVFIADLTWRPTRPVPQPSPRNGRGPWIVPVGAYLKAGFTLSVRYNDQVIDRRMVTTAELLDHEENGVVDAKGNIIQHSGWTADRAMVTRGWPHWDGGHPWFWVENNLTDHANPSYPGWPGFGGSSGYNLLARFETNSVRVAPTATESAALAQLRDEVSNQVAQVLSGHQAAYYQTVLTNLNGATPLNKAVAQLSARFQLYSAYVAFGMARTLAVSDQMRAALFAKQSVSDAYEGAIEAIRTGIATPKVDAIAFFAARITALDTLTTQTLDGIQRKTIVESLPLVENAFAAMDLYKLMGSPGSTATASPGIVSTLVTGAGPAANEMTGTQAPSNANGFVTASGGSPAVNVGNLSGNTSVTAGGAGGSPTNSIVGGADTSPSLTGVTYVKASGPPSNVAGNTALSASGTQVAPSSGADSQCPISGSTAPPWLVALTTAVRPNTTLVVTVTLPGTLTTRGAAYFSISDKTVSVLQNGALCVLTIASTGTN
jgi:hypothetical protein